MQDPEPTSHYPCLSIGPDHTQAVRWTCYCNVTTAVLIQISSPKTIWFIKYALITTWVKQDYIRTTTPWIRSRYSIVGIATGYGKDDGGVGVRVPVGSRIFSPPRCPDWLWGPPNLLLNGYWGLFPGSKLAGTCGWPLTSSESWDKENVDLYIHSPIHLHGIMLN
jgi:hypothetical protein